MGDDALIAAATVSGNRLFVISVLCAIDSNGTFSDGDSLAEGLEPLTLQEAKDLLSDMVSR